MLLLTAMLSTILEFFACTMECVPKIYLFTKYLKGPSEGVLHEILHLDHCTITVSSVAKEERL